MKVFFVNCLNKHEYGVAVAVIAAENAQQGAELLNAHIAAYNDRTPFCYLDFVNAGMLNEVDLTAPNLAGIIRYIE